MNFFSKNRNNTKSIIITCISAAMILFLTSNKLPNRIITQDKMVEILVDLELTKSLAYNYNHTDDEANQVFEQNVNLIYTTHNLSPEAFKESYIYYMKQPQIFLTIYNEVVYKLENML